MCNGNRNKLKIVYQNVPGTLSKVNMITTIQSLLDRIDPDVLAIAEPDTQDIDIDWSPYILIPGKIKNGTNMRLNILIKSDLKFTQTSWRVEVPNLTIEVAGWKFIFAYREWAKCGNQTTKTLACQEERWQGFVERWGKERGKRTILMGNLNFDYRNGEGHQRQLKKIRSLVHEEIIADGWYQLIRDNTRYQNNSKSCLDHIYVRSHSDIRRVWNKNQTGYDHNCIGVDINLSNYIIHPQVTYYRDITGIAIDDFTLCFLTLDLAGLASTQHVDEAAELLTHYINVVLNKLAPMKKRVMKMRKSAEWMTPQIRERIKERNAMRVKATRSGHKHHWEEFKKYRNLLKSDMIAQKRHWTLSQLTRVNTDPKARWRALKTATEGKRLVNDINLDVDGVLLTDPEAVANHLNRYYVKKVQDIIDVSPPDPEQALEYTRQYMAKIKPPPEFEYSCVTESEVLNLIMNLKMTGAVGHDGISTAVIKKFHQVLLPHITRIINLSIMTSMYPQCWKFGIISPVPKGGDPSVDKNWRPVTLLPIMSKLLEGVLNGQLKAHMERHRILGASQHAYRSSKSTQTAWADLDAKIQKATDAGKYVGLLLVDMSAAFNLVSKEVIVPKLKLLGVGEFAARLLFSYLTSRQSRVKVKGVYSAWIMVKTGIGEGSVLGPLVFILTIVCCIIVLHRVIEKLEKLDITAAIDDGTYATEVSVSSTEFADDVTGVAVANTEVQLQTTLQLMAEEYTRYFASHGLKINVTKSEHIIIGSPRTMLINVDGRKEADTVKLLGLTFDKHYRFDQHVDKITEKIASRTGQLSKLQGVADEETMRMMANATIQSVASYGCHIYATDPKNVNRVQVKLNKVMRMVTKSKLSTHISDLLLKIKWLKFKETVEHVKVMLMHKIVTTAAAPFCHHLVATAKHQTRYAVRERDLRIAWRPRMARRGEKSFLYTSVKLFNQVKLTGKVMKHSAISKFVKDTVLSWRRK